jgi:hypothetical protein
MNLDVGVDKATPDRGPPGRILAIRSEASQTHGRSGRRVAAVLDLSTQLLATSVVEKNIQLIALDPSA